MNSNTNPRRTSTSVRRAVPALAIVVLAVGLGACQTPGFRAAVPQAPVIQPAEVPAGIDTNRPADRIEQALEAQANERAEAQLQQVQSGYSEYRGLPADRIEAQLQYEAQLRQAQSPYAEYRGLPADRVDEAMAREQAGTGRFDGLTADRIEEQLEREAAGAPVYY